MDHDNLSCLLCCTSISESILASESERFKFTASSPLENNLDVIFLLRNLLQVPSIQLENQLKNCGDNPEDWIRLCDQCTYLSKKARKLDKDIKRIEKEIKSIQKQVLEKVQSSNVCDNLRNSFGEEIRSFVKSNDYQLDESLDDHGFFEGDKQAKYLETQPTSTKIIILVKKSCQEAEVKEEAISPPVSPPAAEDTESSDEDDDTTVVKQPPPPPITVEEAQTYLCDHCGDQFNTEAFMKMHVMKVHKVKVKRLLGRNPGQGMTCSVCGKGFKRTKQLHSHLLTRHKDDPITKRLQEETGLFHRYCSVVGCGGQFMKQIDEDRHMAKVHPNGKNDNDEKPHKCRFCGRGFWSWNKCWRHERIHEVKGKVRHITKWKPSQAEKPVGVDVKLDKRFKCADCGKSWIKAKSWSDHIWEKEGIRDITCPGVKCGMVFKNNLAEFQAHWKRTHWSDKAKDVKKKAEGIKGLICKICGKELRSKDNLLKHVKFVHDKQFEYSCPLCEIEMPSPSNLKIHLLAVHGEDPVSKQLKEEEGLKLVRCEMTGCGAAFLKKELFDKHVQKWHAGGEGNGGYRFKCNICGKGFWRRGKLVKHERLHEEKMKRRELKEMG